MLSLLTTTTLFTHILLASAGGLTVERRQPSNHRALAACDHIKARLESSTHSQVFDPLSPQYTEDIHHYANSSTQLPACVVEPGVPEDVATVLKVIGKERVEFAVQSGGHAYNPKFSSTTGVHISMARFNQIDIAKDRLTVDVGPGQVWTRVYERFDETGRMVIGGRADGPGVGGLLAGGGGFSWLSNEYGLAVDAIEEYTLVTPTGKVRKVSAKSDLELFGALKGTANNFGIITNFKIRTFEQAEQIYGGYVFYTPEVFPQVLPLIERFSSPNNTDNKAALLGSFASFQGQQILALQIYYNGETPPAGLFDPFLAIPSMSSNVTTRPFSDLVTATSTAGTDNMQALPETAPVKGYSAAFLKKVTELIATEGAAGSAHSGVFLAISVEPFTSGAFAHGLGNEAFPHQPENACFPTFLSVSYTSAADDDYWSSTLRNMKDALLETARSEGQDLSACPYYPNYAAAATPVDEMYLGNLPVLKALKKRYDPDNVMGLTGGFKI